MNTTKQLNGTITIILLSFVIVGTLIGASILALPICLGIAGAIPSCIALVILAILMITCGIIIGEHVNRKQDPTFDFPSLYEELLGKKMKWLAIVANLVLMYGFLIAYLSGLTSILGSFFSFPDYLITCVVFAILTFFNVFGLKLIYRSNGILVLTVFVSFIILLIMTSEHIHLSRLKHINIPFLVIGVPVILGAFYYHNIIPVVCRKLNYERKKVNITIIIGVSIGLIMTLTWTIATTGVLPVHSHDTVNLVHAYKNNLPATIPMRFIFSSQVFIVANIVFACVAIVTSYWGFGVGLSGYIRDIRSTLGFKGNHFYNLVLCFTPPLVITLFFPHIFIVIITLIGGICVSFLFGILPAIMLFKEKALYKKLFASLMIIIFSAITILIILDKFGFFKKFQSLLY